MKKLNWFGTLFVMVISLFAGNTALALGLNIANEPIFLGGAADSNIVFTLDDSGSMGWDYIPDYIARNERECKQNRTCVEGDPPYYAHSSNGIYYDPSVTYTPAVDSTNVSKGNIGSPWTSVANDAFGVSGGTTNLVSGYPDIAYCGGTSVVYDGLVAMSYGCGLGALPCMQKSGTIVRIQLATPHGLVNGDIIDVTSGGGTCDKDARVTGAPVTVIDATTFTYDERGNNSIATGSTFCKITKQNCLRNGIDTANPFQYRTAVVDDPYTHGVPSNPYVTASKVSGNAFFFVPVIQEYCADKTLTSCVASAIPTAGNPEPAYVRFCDTWAHADDVPGTNVGCQARFDAAHTAPRYSKFYRQDIVPAGTFGNVQVGGVTVIDRNARTDCAAAPNCSYTEEMTNFANWFTYYRTRINTMKTGVGRAFAQLNGNIRIGFAKINQGSTPIEGVTSNGAMLLGVRNFSGADKTNWFNQFYSTKTGNSTPLRKAMDYVGQYYKRKDSRGPWATDPATGTVTVSGTVVNENPVDHSACRQSYNVFSTDGYWNGNVPSSVSGTNVDGTAGNPYQDAWSETLADVAMYYWQNDLRTDLADVVPTSPADSANWQHVVDYTIGFGVTGLLDPAVDLPGLKAGTTAWPKPVSNTETTIDDLWHASINGHGQHFSVKSGTDIVQALVNTLADIRDRESSAAAVSLNSTSLQIGTTVYRGEMNTGDWSGDLFAYAISDGTPSGPCPTIPAGQLCTTPLWNASTVLSSSLSPAGSTYWDTGRIIATYNIAAKSAMPFRWASLNASQQTVMRTNPDSGATETITIGQRRVDYLRGKNDSLFRPRLNYLGDIVYSSPVYVGSTMNGTVPVASYPDTWPGTTAPENTGVPYSTWASDPLRAGRTAMVYVGANDGMLHAFRASDGVEQFAFIPGEVYGTVDVPAGKYGRINQLTSTTYANKHIYFVDGTPKVEDAFFGGSWHTALVGSLRAGGRGIYAMDVTDPSAMTSEAAVASKVLWEFTEADDPDLGLTFSDPYIARMQDGRWAAVVGNGYNNSTADGAKSATGHAVLFVLYLDANLADGKWDLGTDYRKYDTRVGSVGTPNGLASATVADVDSDMLADFVYVGDLQGNMWKVDVTSPIATNWGFALGAGSPAPLFTAIGTDTYAQPITTAPEVGIHPTVPHSYMIYFGTGKDIEAVDNRSTGKQTQTFYGIWDKDGQAGGFSAFDRSHLLQQSILSEVVSGAISYRVVSTNPISWFAQAGTPPPGSGTYLGWYIDLINTQGGNTNNFGERQSTNSLLRGGRIFFTTQIPSLDPCKFGGSGWLMALDANDGSMLAMNPFRGGPASAAGRKFEHLPSAPVYIGGHGTDYIYVSDSSGATEVVEVEPPMIVDNGRKSWRQLQ